MEDTKKLLVSGGGGGGSEAAPRPLRLRDPAGTGREFSTQTESGRGRVELTLVRPEETLQPPSGN